MVTSIPEENNKIPTLGKKLVTRDRSEHAKMSVLNLHQILYTISQYSFFSPKTGVENEAENEAEKISSQEYFKSKKSFFNICSFLLQQSLSPSVLKQYLEESLQAKSQENKHIPEQKIMQKINQEAPHLIEGLKIIIELIGRKVNISQKNITTTLLNQEQFTPIDTTKEVLQQPSGERLQKAFVVAKQYCIEQSKLEAPIDESKVKDIFLIGLLPFYFPLEKNILEDYIQQFLEIIKTEKQEEEKKTSYKAIKERPTQKDFQNFIQEYIPTENNNLDNML